MQTSDTPVYPIKILAALNTVMAKVGYVQKQGENKFHGYKYAGEGNLLEVLRPAMVEAGLVLIPSHAEKSEIDAHGNVTVLVEYTLAHKDGDVWPEKIKVYGSGNDRAKSGAVGDKGVYKAATGANKYLLFKLFQIETGDDPEKDSDHDKDGAPVQQQAAPTAPAKNAPGVTKARTWVNDHIRDLHGCESAAQFMEMVEAQREYWVKIKAVYPNVWEGPDGSGLRGEALKQATAYECRPSFDLFLKEIEAEAADYQQPKAAE